MSTKNQIFNPWQSFCRVKYNLIWTVNRIHHTIKGDKDRFLIRARGSESGVRASVKAPITSIERYPCWHNDIPRHPRLSPSPFPDLTEISYFLLSWIYRWWDVVWGLQRLCELLRLNHFIFIIFLENLHIRWMRSLLKSRRIQFNIQFTKTWLVVIVVMEIITVS